MDDRTMIEELRIELQRQRGMFRAMLEKVRNDPRDPEFITCDEFAALLRISRRQLDRMRKVRPIGFPPEMDLSMSTSPKKRVPRFRLSDARAFAESRGI